MITNSEKKCDLCQSVQVTEIYAPTDSNRSAVVYLCRSCGLIQTFYGDGEYSRHAPSISSGAGWGNIRHGKALRLTANLQLLEKHVPAAATSVLDIGANRGDFVRWLLEHRKDTLIDVIEPDQMLTSEYNALNRVNFIGERIENVKVETGRYEFVLCLHTLEHAFSARGMLQQARDSLTTDGRLLVEVPDLDSISDPNVVEDFFIDKHSFHFSDSSLRNMFRIVGLGIVDGLKSDNRNLNYVLARDYPGKPETDIREVERAASKVSLFKERLETNRRKLKSVTVQIEALATRQSVGIWGASRIFDALVRFGGLKADKFLVIDDYLVGKVPSMHGAKINHSSVLRTSKPQVLVVLAKGSAQQIRERARSYGVKNVISFDELFEQTN